MTGKTHLLVGTAVGIYGAVHFGNSSETMLFIVASAALGSLLPDLDSPKSIITNLIPPARLLFFWTTHRGILHTGLIVGLLALIAYFLASPILWALTVGYASHLLLDSLTKGGIPLFFPLWGANIHFLPSPLAITTGGISESLFVLLGIIASIFYFFPDIVQYVAMFR